MTTPWPWAWQQALYGRDGFYRRPEGPAGHFATSTQGLGETGRVMAEALLALTARHGLERIVDVGAGRGELLTRIAEQAAGPGRAVRLAGVDVVERPAGLPDEVDWWLSPGGPGLPDRLRGLRDTLVVAHEWLDVVPCPVVQEVEGVWRPLAVAGDGTEEVVGDLGPEEADWLERWWPVPPEGAGGDAARAEVGLTRDRAHADLLGRVDRGIVLVVDYGHTRGERPHQGSLTAYRSGTQVEPVPDGTCDITAHVAVDSLGADRLVRQREALHDLLGRVGLPSHDQAGEEPAAYLAGLARAGAGRVLTDPGGLGGFWWAMTGRGGVDLG